MKFAPKEGLALSLALTSLKVCVSIMALPCEGMNHPRTPLPSGLPGEFKNDLNQNLAQHDGNLGTMISHGYEPKAGGAASPYGPVRTGAPRNMDVDAEG
eukprot:1914654-Amphidinium_carterae.2